MTLYDKKNRGHQLVTILASLKGIPEKKVYGLLRRELGWDKDKVHFTNANVSRADRLILALSHLIKEHSIKQQGRLQSQKDRIANAQNPKQNPHVFKRLKVRRDLGCQCPRCDGTVRMGRISLYKYFSIHLRSSTLKLSTPR